MYLKFTKSTIQTYKIQGWTLALQAYSVLEICKCYHTKIPKFKGGRWRYKLTVSMKLAKSAIQRYKISRVDIQGRCRYKLTVSLKFAKSTMERCTNSRVDVGATNLQCP